LNSTSKEDNVLTEAQIEQFRMLGLLVLPGGLDGVTLGRLIEEVDEAVAAAGPRRTEGGHYVPAGDRPGSVALTRRLLPLAEQLLGREAFPAAAHETLFFAEAWWHVDVGPDVQALKVAVYLETLDAGNGALRVIPATHLIPQRELDALHGSNPHQIPCHIIESKPGDVIVFHAHLWHASLNGHHRRQWSVEYFAFPANERERSELARLGPEWRDEPEWGPVHARDRDRLRETGVL